VRHGSRSWSAYETAPTTVVLQWCYSGVTVVLQWCYSGIKVVLQWCYTIVTLLLHGSSSWSVCGSAPALHGVDDVVTLLLYCCYTVLTLLLQCGHTGITLWDDSVGATVV
jgi:hypothetical protein